MHAPKQLFFALLLTLCCALASPAVYAAETTPAAKQDAPKADAAKADTAKPDAPKPDAAKPDTPKADASKQVDILGNFPLPVEVIPMARSAVARQLVKLGGRPEYRQGVVTDNGNVILDVHGLEILDAIALENAINGIPGVVTVGLFANRGADVALIGTADGVKTIVK